MTAPVDVTSPDRRARTILHSGEPKGNARMPVHKQRTFELSDAEVGAALRAARNRARLDIRDAGEAAGIDWRVLSRIERGERPCRVTELVALSEANGVAPVTVLQAALGWESAWVKLGRPKR